MKLTRTAVGKCIIFQRPGVDRFHNDKYVATVCKMPNGKWSHQVERRHRKGLYKTAGEALRAAVKNNRFVGRPSFSGSRKRR